MHNFCTSPAWLELGGGGESRRTAAQTTSPRARRASAWPELGQLHVSPGVRQSAPSSAKLQLRPKIYQNRILQLNKFSPKIAQTQPIKPKPPSPNFQHKAPTHYPHVFSPRRSRLNTTTMARIKQVAVMLAPGQRKIVRMKTVRRRPAIVISDSEDDSHKKNEVIVISDSNESSSDDESWWL